MNDRENLETVEGDAASIILNSPKRVRTGPPVQSPVQSVPEEPISTEKPLSLTQRKNKLERDLTAAKAMSRNRSFPKLVRQRFVDRATQYERDLAAL